MATLSQRINIIENDNSDAAASTSEILNGASNSTILAPAEASELEAETELQRKADHYEHNFRTAELDPSASGLAESPLKAAQFNSEFEGSTMGAIECRGTLCRMELTHKNEAATQSFMSHFPDVLPWGTQGQFIADRQTDGSIHGVFYFSTNGHQLPLLK